jgi:hypothetical protein
MGWTARGGECALGGFELEFEPQWVEGGGATFEVDGVVRLEHAAGQQSAIRRLGSVVVARDARPSAHLVAQLAPYRQQAFLPETANLVFGARRTRVRRDADVHASPFLTQWTHSSMRRQSSVSGLSSIHPWRRHSAAAAPTVCCGAHLKRGGRWSRLSRICSLQLARGTPSSASPYQAGWSGPRRRQTECGPPRPDRTRHMEDGLSRSLRPPGAADRALANPPATGCAVLGAAHIGEPRMGTSRLPGGVGQTCMEHRDRRTFPPARDLEMSVDRSPFLDPKKWLFLAAAARCCAPADLPSVRAVGARCCYTAVHSAAQPPRSAYSVVTVWCE